MALCLGASSLAAATRRARLQDSATLWMSRNVTLRLMAEVGAPAPWRREGEGAAVKGMNALALPF